MKIAAFLKATGLSSCDVNEIDPSASHGSYWAKARLVGGEIGLYGEEEPDGPWYFRFSYNRPGSFQWFEVAKGVWSYHQAVQKLAELVAGECGPSQPKLKCITEMDCLLSIDHDRGVIYVHLKDAESVAEHACVTALRIQGLPKPIPLLKLLDGGIDIGIRDVSTREHISGAKGVHVNWK